MQTIVRHGTGCRIVVKTTVPGMITKVTKGAVRISVGVPPIVSTPEYEPVAYLRSA